MATGTVRRWNDDKGYGFVEKDTGGDIFAHISDVNGRVEELTPGQRVQFDEGKDARNGKTHAQNITII